MEATKAMTNRMHSKIAWTKFPDSPDLCLTSNGERATGTNVPFTGINTRFTCFTEDILAHGRFTAAMHCVLSQRELFSLDLSPFSFEAMSPSIELLHKMAPPA